MNNEDLTICNNYRAQAEQCCEDAGGVLDENCSCCIGCDLSTTTSPLTTTTTPFTSTIPITTTTFDCRIVVNNEDPTICNNYRAQAEQCCEDAGGVLDENCSCCIGCDLSTTTSPLTTTTTPFTSTTPITTTTFDCRIVVNNEDPTICNKYRAEAERCCEEAGGVLDDLCFCCINCGVSTTTTPLTTTTPTVSTTSCGSECECYYLACQRGDEYSCAQYADKCGDNLSTTTTPLTTTTTPLTTTTPVTTTTPIETETCCEETI